VAKQQLSVFIFSGALRRPFRQRHADLFNAHHVAALKEPSMG
jgi:hypothetical protein